MLKFEVISCNRLRWLSFYFWWGGEETCVKTSCESMPVFNTPGKGTTWTKNPTPRQSYFAKAPPNSNPRS